MPTVGQLYIKLANAKQRYEEDVDHSAEWSWHIEYLEDQIKELKQTHDELHLH